MSIIHKNNQTLPPIRKINFPPQFLRGVVSCEGWGAGGLERPSYCQKFQSFVNDLPVQTNYTLRSDCMEHYKVFSAFSSLLYNVKWTLISLS